MKGDTTNSVTTGKLATPVHNVNTRVARQTNSRREFRGCPFVMA